MAHAGFLRPAPLLGGLGRMETPARPGGARRTDAGPLASDASGAMALSSRGSLCGAAGADVSGPLVCRVSPPVYPEPEVFTGFLGAPRSHPARAHRPRQRPLSRTATARSGQAGSSAPAGAEWDVDRKSTRLNSSHLG